MTPPSVSERPTLAAVAWWRRLPGLRLWLARGPTRALQAALAESLPCPAAVRAALEKGANPSTDVPTPLGGSQGPHWEPAIVSAARRGCVETLAWLHAAGANLEAHGDGPFDRTPFATAVVARQWDAARWLEAHGADWHCALHVLDPDSLGDAMSLGGLDPQRIRTKATTLWALLTGAQRCLKDDTLGKPPLRSATGTHALLAQRRARELEAVWALPPPPASSRARL